jgi:hypothetical protein
MSQHGVLEDEFSATPNQVDRCSARDAGSGVGGHRFPDGAGSRPDPVDDLPQVVHLQFRPRSGSPINAGLRRNSCVLSRG